MMTKMTMKENEDDNTRDGEAYDKRDDEYDNK